MPDTPPEVIVKKLDIAWQFIDKHTSMPAVTSSQGATMRLEVFKTVYDAISKAVNENDLSSPSE